MIEVPEVEGADCIVLMGGGPGGGGGGGRGRSVVTLFRIIIIMIRNKRLLNFSNNKLTGRSVGVRSFKMRSIGLGSILSFERRFGIGWGTGTTTHRPIMRIYWYK